MVGGREEWLKEGGVVEGGEEWLNEGVVEGGEEWLKEVKSG